MDNELREENVNKKKRGRKRYVLITYVFLGLFLLLLVRLLFFTAVESEDFINSSYNPRLTKLSETVVRGKIKTSDDVIVAETITNDDKTEVRNYPKGPMYAHAVGYSVNGSLGAEKDFNFRMMRSHIFFLKRIYLELSGEKLPGDDLVLTIDSKLQEAAYYGMGDYDGAVIALEPDTGKVLCMVSKPDFDPNTIKADWDSIISDSTSSVLLNRTTQGLYPPGSVAKVLTALEMMEEGKADTFSYECEGEEEREGYTIHCYRSTAHGTEDFASAFADSCNVAFGNMGLMLDKNRLSLLSDRLLFNKKLPTALSNTEKSSFNITDKDSEALVMQTAIGQGKTLVTPLHMAMLASAVANEGVIKEPFISDSIENADGGVVKTYKGKTYGSVMTKEEAEKMKELMRLVITDGTGQGLLSDDYTAYGKTGTAEYSSDKDKTHSWFMGFAEKDGRKIAAAVIMEGAGTSSAHAIPLTKSLFDTYFQNE